MNDFLRQLELDLQNIFHNIGEFAESAELKYNGRTITAPVVIDTCIQVEQDTIKKRGFRSNENIPGIFDVDITLYVPVSFRLCAEKRAAADCARISLRYRACG